MRCVDVNVLVYAFRADTRQHDAYRVLLERWANDDETLGLPDVVLSGFLRVTTNRRVFKEPTAPETAWQQVDDLVDAPASRVLTAGRRHRQVFRELADSIAARGNDIADAYLAAYARENGAIWLSADRGFARFPALSWQHPLSA